MRRLFPIFLLALFLSCSVTPPAESPLPNPQEEREDLITRIRAQVFDKDYRETRKLGKRYLETYGGEPGEGEVRLLVGESDIELGFFEEARTIVDPLVEDPSFADQRGEALVLLARIDQAKGMYTDAVSRLMEALSVDLNQATYLEARSRLAEAVNLLSEKELEDIMERFGAAHGIDIVLEGYLSYAMAAGDTSAVRKIKKELSGLDSLKVLPDGLYREGKKEYIEYGRVDGSVRFRLGLLCPLSGRFAPLGNEFLKGASLAMKEARQKGMTGMELVVGDTGANALTAYSVTERLIDTEKVTALVGGVLSSTTIAAAQVAQYRMIPLFSPVASEEGIEAVGEYIYQQSTDSEVEITAIARVACRKLGLRRIAYMAVDGIRSRRLGSLFRSEVELAGGVICAEEYYEQGSTDFQHNIARLRQAEPEALFISSDTEDLVLILPQLSFYEFGVQLLGTSVWNSKNLLRMAGRDMDGAIFPKLDDVAGGEERFRAAASLAGEQFIEVNRFLIGGYIGVSRMIEAMAACSVSGRTLLEEMSDILENRRYRFIDIVTGAGVQFYIVRDEKPERYYTLRIDN